MKNRKRFWGMTALALTFGLLAAGCPTGSDDGGDPPIILPESKGANELSGKTYVAWQEKIVFAPTDAGAANGTYSLLRVKRDNENRDVLDDNNKFVYIEIETGCYAWDETAKTVVIGPEKVAKQEGNNQYGPLQTKAEYRAALQTEVNQFIELMTPEELAEELAQMGFSSVADFIEADVADAFGNVTHNYAFSSDGKALFLDEPLPANKGVNELAGQTYNRAEWNDETEEYEDTGRTYVFTVDSCTDYESQTYSYAYDNAQKVVYLKKPTANRDAEYTASTNTLPGNFATAEERNAAQVNSQYRRRVITYRYDSAEKFIFY